MILKVNVDSEIPVYRQIVDSLRPLLVNGKLAPGTSLPSVRQLAADLAVHFNTVAEAYRILADEGWLDVQRRRGAVVMSREMPLATAGTLTNFSRRLREMIAEVQAGGVRPRFIARELREIAEALDQC